MIDVWLALSAIGAGMMNAIAGGGTLLTFPALMTTVTAVEANVTSTVALMPGSCASAWGYRRQLAECGQWVWLLSIPSVIGGAIGSLLLIWLDPRVFKVVVPWLVLLAATLFLLQPYLAKWMLRHRTEGPPTRRALAIIVICQFFISVYGGYFGAGIGILMLSSLGFLGLANIHQMNSLKTLLAFEINFVSVIFFILDGKIVWRFAILMAVAAIAGGYFGARLALRIKPIYVRWIVIVIGFSLAGYFFWRNWNTGE
jgi:uncharacterized membrane protein YfcA